MAWEHEGEEYNIGDRMRFLYSELASEENPLGNYDPGYNANRQYSTIEGTYDEIDQGYGKKRPIMRTGPAHNEWYPLDGPDPASEIGGGYVEKVEGDVEGVHDVHNQPLNTKAPSA